MFYGRSNNDFHLLSKLRHSLWNGTLAVRNLNLWYKHGCWETNLYRLPAECFASVETSCFCCREPVRTSRETFIERAAVNVQHSGAARCQWERAPRSEIWHHAAADHRRGELSPPTIFNIVDHSLLRVNDLRRSATKMPGNNISLRYEHYLVLSLIFLF